MYVFEFAEVEDEDDEVVEEEEVKGHTIFRKEFGTDFLAQTGESFEFLDVIEWASLQVDVSDQL